MYDIAPLTPLEAPVSAVMPAFPQAVMVIGFAILVIAALVWALGLLKTKSDDRLLIMLGCGAAASLIEGLACHLIQCHHTSIGIIEVYQAFGIHVPLWLAEVYVLFFGVGTYLFLSQFSKAPTAKTFWWSFAIIGIGEAAFEMANLPLGMWRYWGVQPLPVFGFPLHLGFINPSMAVVFGAAATAWFRLVKGPTRYVLIAITAPLIGGLYAGLAMPVAAGLYARDPALSLMGSALTIITALAVSWSMYRLMRFLTLSR